MALRNRSVALLLFIFSLNLGAEMVEVASKQSLPEMRYSSADGKIIYYQNHSGELLYATNYKVKQVLKSSVVRNTNYQVILSPERKYALIAQDVTMHDFISLRKELKIYLLKVGETSPLFLGEGTSPSLHLKDRWLSYYRSISKKLIIRGIENSNREYQIQLSNRINPYFISQVVMTSDTHVLYTDLNKEGLMGVLDYDLETGKIVPILKTTSALERIELCANNSQIFIGLFGLNKSSMGSAITAYDYTKQTFPDRQIIYESTKNDIGNLKCQTEGKLFFVKNESTLPQKFEQFAIAQLDFTLSTEVKPKVTLLTTPDANVQLVEMDGKIFIESLGKYFLLYGENNLGKDQWLKK